MSRVAAAGDGGRRRIEGRDGDGAVLAVAGVVFTHTGRQGARARNLGGAVGDAGFVGCLAVVIPSVEENGRREAGKRQRDNEVLGEHDEKGKCVSGRWRTNVKGC